MFTSSALQPSSNFAARNLMKCIIKVFSSQILFKYVNKVSFLGQFPNLGSCPRSQPWRPCISSNARPVKAGHWLKISPPPPPPLPLPQLVNSHHCCHLIILIGLIISPCQYFHFPGHSADDVGNIDFDHSVALAATRNGDQYPSCSSLFYPKFCRFLHE